MPPKPMAPLPVIATEPPQATSMALPQVTITPTTMRMLLLPLPMPMAPLLATAMALPLATTMAPLRVEMPQSMTTIMMTLLPLRMSLMVLLPRATEPLLVTTMAPLLTIMTTLMTMPRLLLAIPMEPLPETVMAPLLAIITAPLLAAMSMSTTTPPHLPAIRTVWHRLTPMAPLLLKRPLLTTMVPRAVKRTTSTIFPRMRTLRLRPRPPATRLDVPDARAAALDAADADQAAEAGLRPPALDAPGVAATAGDRPPPADLRRRRRGRDEAAAFSPSPFPTEARPGTGSLPREDKSLQQDFIECARMLP